MKMIRVIKSSKSTWEYVGDGSVLSKIEWLYTHNINLNKNQYNAISDLRDYLKNEKELSADDVERLLYLLKTHNKNYKGDQYYLTQDFKVEDFIK